MRTPSVLAKTNAILLAVIATLALASCSSSSSEERVTISIDGSSTVFPISQAVAEEYSKQHPNVRIPIAQSGTGGGFKKFALGETDINNASRPIKGTEIDKCGEHGVDFIELPIAYDGISVVCNPANTFLQDITIEELRKIWHPEQQVSNWSDVRAGWPQQKIQLYGPGADSGTFDYFTEVINGQAQLSRSDYTPSEDDNVLVRAVAGDVNALAFFGYAYYAQNKDQLKLVAVDGGKGPIAPSAKTINDGSYAPLSRPLFIYLSKDAVKRKEVQDFIRFYIQNAAELATDVGYVPLPKPIYAAALKRLSKLITGSAYSAPNAKDKSLSELFGEPGA